MGKCLELLLQTSFRKGTNVLLLKGTLHTGMKEAHVKTTMITSASSDVGCLKKSIKKKKMMENRRFNRCLSVRCVLATWGILLGRKSLE